MGSARVWTVPNILSALRLKLAVVCFLLLEQGSDAAALAAFVVAAGTDWVDGWYARKYGQVSRLGRILDPLVDKVLVGGAFILLAARPGAAILPWMAVVVVVRELVVTAVRAEMERMGRDFSAGMAGKLKMVLQCAAVVAELGRSVGLLDASDGVAIVSWIAWAAVALTAWSGIEYVVKAWPVITGPETPSR